MRLIISVYVFVRKEGGRKIYSCCPLRGPQVITRDPLLSVALAKLGGQVRSKVNAWIKQGQAERITSWLYDANEQGRTVKLNLVLRDRTLRWRLMLVSQSAFGRYVVYSPSIPEVRFEVDSLSELENRAVEVYTHWAASKVAEGLEYEYEFEMLENSGEMWIEPLEIDAETHVASKKKASKWLAALFGEARVSGSEELHRVGQCLDELVSDYEPAIGQKSVVDEVDRMLQRDDRQGVLVVGPPGVGKTALIHECILRRAERFQHRRDEKPRVWWLSPQRLISGMSYLGQWEQRWLAILREAANRDHILYFDDLVGLFTAGRTRDSSLSAADVLRGFLAEHRVRILAESTAEQLALLRRRDRALADRFHLIHVPEMSAGDALPVVVEALHRLEVRTSTFFHPLTLPDVMRQAETLAPDRAFPGKAIDACKTLTKHFRSSIDPDEYATFVTKRFGIQVAIPETTRADQERIANRLSTKLIGQPAAVNALSRIVIRYWQRLQPRDRPAGVLLLLGPTGVGKTEAAKALARLLYTDESHLVRLDMNELTTAYAAEQLVGSFEQPEGRLTSAVRRQPNCVIVLDEIEKAHPDVFDYLLQVLGEGRLTDSRGRVADFRSSIIVMTSNLGALEQNASLGFDITSERRQQIYIKAAQQFFRPEFFNRIDEVVPFRSLDRSDMEKIVAIQLQQVLTRDGLRRRPVFASISDAAIELVIQHGFDSRLGARAVRRMLESEIIGPLADCLSGMLHDQPALIEIDRPLGKARLECSLRVLEIAQPTIQNASTDLEQIVSRGKILLDRLDENLTNIEEELREVDKQKSGKSHGESYYALREQLYRCTALLKTANERIETTKAPQLNVSQHPQSPVKPNRDFYSPGVRRDLIDWQVQLELYSAVGNRAASDEVATQELSTQLIDSFKLADRMVQWSLQPQAWAVGFRNLTSAKFHLQLDRALGSDENELRSGFDYTILDAGDGSYIPDPLSIWARCLKEKLQYDIDMTERMQGFIIVSGVSIFGMLKPLLGTYKLQLPSGQSVLVLLDAVEVVPGMIDHETRKLFSSDGPKPANSNSPDWNWPNTIRGSLGFEIVDYRSGAKLDLPRRYDQRADMSDKTLKWWTDCLPLPEDFL